MTDRPIIFPGGMVRAILAGTKTETRRIVKPQPPDYPEADRKPPPEWLGTPKHPKPYLDAYNHGLHWCWWDEWDRQGPGWFPVPFAAGDRLWVREAFKDIASGQIVNGYGEIRYGVGYRADGATAWQPHVTKIWAGDRSQDAPMQFGPKPWRSPIHMRRRWSRITLAVTEVRVERLQEISRESAIAEGLTLASSHIEEFWRWPAPYDESLWLSPVAAYRSLWEQIHGPGSWNANPWVAAVRFTATLANIDAGGAP